MAALARCQLLCANSSQAFNLRDPLSRAHDHLPPKMTSRTGSLVKRNVPFSHALGRFHKIPKFRNTGIWRCKGVKKRFAIPKFRTIVNERTPKSPSDPAPIVVIYHRKSFRNMARPFKQKVGLPKKTAPLLGARSVGFILAFSCSARPRRLPAA
ncbi:MAG: hypothetical protein LBG83_03190 [Oscillospiraceae bacterium]|jgi:hypothetical protein|nr:hypothetical protein [Oscillospiraceae bacterium]